MFNAAAPGLLAASKACNVEAEELQLALALSLGDGGGAQGGGGGDGEEGGEKGGGGSGGACFGGSGVMQARRLRRHIKPLGLIWASAEFGPLYSAANTLIVDDTLDVCAANPRNCVQVSRYQWTDAGTDDELPRLAAYLARIAAAGAFPASHERWRDHAGAAEGAARAG